MHALPRRASFLDDNDPTKVLFRSYALALDDFVKANPSFDADNIAMISFVFDGSDKGAIIMDDISIRAAGPVADHAASASPLSVQRLRQFAFPARLVRAPEFLEDLGQRLVGGCILRVRLDRAAEVTLRLGKLAVPRQR